MAIASKTSMATVARTWTFIIIVCFAGSAAGSCLSYGHSCWGAHGKRSGGHNNQYMLPLKGSNDVQQGVPSITKEQLVMSRLIGRLLTSDKYRGRWDRFLKMKSNFPEHVTTRVIDNEPVWDQNNDDDIRGGKRKRMNDVQDMIKNMNNEEKEIPDILLISNNEENEHGSNPQNNEFLKVLVDSIIVN